MRLNIEKRSLAAGSFYFSKKAGEGMASKKIGAYITLDGEKQFRTAVTACNKSLSMMKSEMQLVDAQTAGSANTLEALEKSMQSCQRQ